jgi:hypothetical protein
MDFLMLITHEMTDVISIFASTFLKQAHGI